MADQININLVKKICYFLITDRSVKFLDPNIFETIDKSIESEDINYFDYFLQSIEALPKLDYNNVVKISREVFQLFGKEKEFDEILVKLESNHCIENGSLKKDDDNCITKATESSILLSGTYYDVVLLCHEIGHRLKYDDSMEYDEIMYSFLFEAPSIVLEIAAGDYLRDYYGIDINVKELRRKHIMNTEKENKIPRKIFLSVLKLQKENKLNFRNLYKTFTKNQTIVDFLNGFDRSIESYIEEAISDYSYDIGYIIGNYTSTNDHKEEILNRILKEKKHGVKEPYTIDPDIIKEALASPKNTK